MREEKQSQERGRDDHHGIISNKFCKWQLLQTFCRPPISVILKYHLNSWWGVRAGRSGTPWYWLWPAQACWCRYVFIKITSLSHHLATARHVRWSRAEEGKNCLLQKAEMYHDDLEVARLGWPGFVWEENFFPRFNCDAINIKFYVNLTQVFIVSIKKLLCCQK